MDKIRAILIDDEPLARDLLRHMLNAVGGVDIVDECENGFEGIKSVEEYKPDLLFLDIQMPKLTGFEMLEILADRPEIIFVTAYDDNALKAFEQNAVDYLLKPFDAKRLQTALDKAVQRIRFRAQQGGNPPIQVAQFSSYTERIVVRSSGKIVIIPAEEIKYLQADGDYVTIHSVRGTFLKDRSLNHLEEKLDQAQFVRVHRGNILNISFLKNIAPYAKNTYTATLTTGETVKVSAAGYKKLREVLEK